MSSSSISKSRSLPLEIEEEILCRLPVKSLNRFRCVSTSWQSLISDPRFIRKHRITATARLNSLFQKTLIHHEHLDSLPLSSLETIRKGCFLGQVDARFLIFQASCDGLFCFRYLCDGTLYICNPSMKLCRQIPHSTANQTYFVGLGYDSLRDDYKIVQLSNNQHDEPVQTEIYSLRTHSWTKADDFPTGKSLEPLSLHSVFVNGAIHMLDYDREPYVVVSFDLSENKYIAVAMPENELNQISLSDPDDPILSLSLCALRGMLCVVFCGEDELVLLGNKDYRDHKSWTRILKISYETLRSKLYFSLDYTPFYVYDNGEVLLGALCGDTYKMVELLICKDGDVVFRQMTRHGMLVMNPGRFIYIESLISLFQTDAKTEMDLD